MTPAARYASAIAVLDEVLAGASAEKCLTSWARANRYAGSKDRAAVRDHVFDVLRRKRSLEGLGGGSSGRALVLGLLRHQGIDPKSIFGAGGYGPDDLTVEELTAGSALQSPAAQYDIPDWLWPIWERDLGANAVRTAKALQDRGPVTLRVNLLRGSIAEAVEILADDDIVARPMPEVKTALQVIENERRIKLSRAYVEGYVDLQDLASQEAIVGLEVAAGSSVLDYCAGGGGKALAMADLFDCRVSAHDISSLRMSDIPVRAARAGVTIDVIEPEALGAEQKFDVVFVDAPCSGSGTWRRAPEAKWALTDIKLKEYNRLQSEVLSKAAGFVKPGGQLIYATCSVLNSENRDVVADFLAGRDGWAHVSENARLPNAQGDGFYHSELKRN